MKRVTDSGVTGSILDKIPDQCRSRTRSEKKLLAAIDYKGPMTERLAIEYRGDPVKLPAPGSDEGT